MRVASVVFVQRDVRNVLTQVRNLTAPLLCLRSLSCMHLWLTVMPLFTASQCASQCASTRRNDSLPEKSRRDKRDHQIKRVSGQMQWHPA